MTRVLNNIRAAADIIKNGGLVAFATETVYGLGGNALDPNAVAKIFEAKQRPHFDPLIVHLASRDQVNEYVTHVSREAKLLMERFWPGPLTLVLPKKEIIPDLVTSGLPSVAVRVPESKQARELIECAGVPIAAPSANLFGSVSPTTVQHVLDGLAGRIDAVLAGVPCAIGVESTVIACPVEATPILLRPGGLPIEVVEELIGALQRIDPTVQDDQSPQAGPGMLSRHYAPAKPIQIVDNWSEVATPDRAGAIAFGPPPKMQFSLTENLSATGSLVEAAANFFAVLRRMETTDIDFIAAKWFPNEGLGLALNDRLRRAAAQ